MSYTYRQAIADDAPECVAVRGKTRENSFSVEQLRARGITVESWREDIATDTLPGYVCQYHGVIVGYCFGSSKTGEIVVLALLPEHESKGIGKELLNGMVREFKRRGFTRLFLGTSKNPGARSYGFYRHLGWKPTGILDGYKDEVLELFV